MPGWVGRTRDWLLDAERWSKWPLPAALTVAAYLGVGQADLLLRQFQQADTRAFGVAALGGGLLPRASDAALAVELWNGRENATHGQAETYLWGHATADVFLVLFVVWLAWALTRLVADQGGTRISDWNRHPFLGPNTEKWWRRPRPLGYVLVFSLATIAFRLVTFYLDGSVAGYVLAYVASKAALIAMVGVVLALLAGLRSRLGKKQELAGQPLWVLDEDRRAERLRFRRAVSVLRGQLGLVLVLSGLLMVDVTGQVADFFRRWDDPVSIVLGLACVLVLSFTLWASARRIILAAETGEPTALTPMRLLLAGLIVAAFGAVVRLVTGSLVAFSLAGVIGVLLALDVFAWFANWKPEKTQQKGAKDRAQQAIGQQSQEDRAAIQELARFVAAVPVAAVGIELVKAGVGP